MENKTVVQGENEERIEAKIKSSIKNLVKYIAQIYKYLKKKTQ